MIELNNLCICLVEPSGLQGAIITSRLNNIGVSQVSRVSTGAEAMEALGSDVPPDAVMSALYLPDMNGTDLIVAIRHHPTQGQTPFLLVSSETNPQNLESVRQAGPIAILPKPFTEAQLTRSVKNILDFLNAEELRDSYADLRLSDMKVLIVDDSKIARRHIRTVLERIGFENFCEAVDGQEAIPQIQDTLFDLVVTDYNMPHMDGLGLVDYIRSRSVQSSVPILMVSSVQDQGRLAAVMDAGVSAIFDKPFEIDSVRNVLGHIFANEDGQCP